MSLFLASPRDQGRTKKKAITSGGPVISGISCPISIRKCTENKRRLSRVEKTMEESALQVSKNAQNNSIVNRSWSRQILAHLVNNIGNVQTSDSEINQVANQASVKRGIRQWFPSCGSQMCIKLNWSVNSLVINESSSRQQLSGILGLSNIKSICRMSDFKTQEVVEISKIFHLKLLTEEILEFLNVNKVITSYDQIIHIQEK